MSDNENQNENEMSRGEHLAEAFKNEARRRNMAAHATRLSIENFINDLSDEDLAVMLDIVEEMVSFKGRAHYYLGVIEATLFTRSPGLCRNCGRSHAGDEDPHSPVIGPF